MKAFAELLESLSYQPQRNGKIRLLTDYLARTPDPDRGFALAALTGTLAFAHAKPALLKAMTAERVDGVLFDLSYDFVGDLAETIALIWPTHHSSERDWLLGELVEALRTTSKASLAAFIAGRLDEMAPGERLAFVKLMTGALRVGVSARLAKTALADWSAKPLAEIEEHWHGLKPPFTELFAWLEGGAEKPSLKQAVRFRPVMLAHPLDEAELAKLDPKDFVAEWKWDGIRVQFASLWGERRLFSRTGEDISPAFPDLLSFTHEDCVIDGELLVIRDGAVLPFAELQKRLGRKQISDKLLGELPAGIMAYDLLIEGEEDLRKASFAERRARLEAFAERNASARLKLSPLVAFKTWEELAELRSGSGAEEPSIEGLMLKGRNASYQAGRIKGLWYKWKREPFHIDAVLMYAARGHGKRASLYSDYTFGVWRAGEQGRELVPVGKAYFGFTDDELAEIDRFVREKTTARFGPVREVVHEEGEGLVLEVAFDAVQRSPRHKSGIALRFPRIARLRWDKPPTEADTIETLEALINASDMRKRQRA